MTVSIPNDFDPRPYQLPFIRYMTGGGSDGRRKRAVAVHHRRAGKDLMGLHTMAMLMLRRVGMYWHVFPTFEQGRKAIWEGFRSDGKRTLSNVFPPELVRRRNEQQMMVELVNGSIYRIIGSDKIEVVGAGPVGVLFSEYSIAKPRAWDLIAPMLRENEGWAAFVYTPRGNNHGKKLFDAAQRNPGAWFSEIRTLFDTRAYDPDQTLSEERAAGRPEALIRQEYLCDWTAANVGSVWGDLIEAIEKAGRVCEFESKARVFTTWDLGGAGAHGDATCFWLWAASDDGIDLLDYYENHGKTLSHYQDEVAKRCAALGVTPVKHWLPHDARSKGGLVTGVSVLEDCVREWGAENVAIYPEVSFLEGIQAARWLLQRDVRFHPRSSEGIEALKAYHYGWDEDRKVFTNQPEHDWSSHPADAFRGVAVVYRHSERLTRPEPKHERPRPYAPPVVKPATLDQAWDQYDRESAE